MAKTGETRAFSPRFGESTMNAELGLEEKLAVVVTQFVWAPLTTTLLQPEGKFAEIFGTILKVKRSCHNATARAIGNESEGASSQTANRRQNTISLGLA